MILVTGGSGYIGSHTCVALAQADHDIVIVDNLSNSRVSVIDRMETLCGKRPQFIQGDIRDAAVLERIFADHSVQAVIHFAGLKAVGESVAKPIEYYDNNVRGTLELLAAMRRAGVKTLVFSSSATVYGDPASVPIREDFPRSATNPYGRSKLIIEDILADLHHAEPDWRIARLRYFNPVGAHESGLIGEDPQGIPNNLMPYIAQVAIGKREVLNVFGNDYPTTDGTGVRDYIHVVDLAEGHIAALNYLVGASLLPPRSVLSTPHRQSRYRPRLLRAGDDQRLRTSERPTRALPLRAPPSGRYCTMLGRSHARQPIARLESHARTGCHVRRCVALANDKLLTNIRIRPCRTRRARLYSQQITPLEQRTTNMKPSLPSAAIVTGSRALAIALTVFLFVAGSFPAAGQAFPGVAHWIAHLAAYALIAFSYALGWKKQPALLVAGFVAALGAIHEYSEIFTHGHALENADILVNAIGAGIGVALNRAIIRASARV